MVVVNFPQSWEPMVLDPVECCPHRVTSRFSDQIIFMNGNYMDNKVKAVNIRDRRPHFHHQTIWQQRPRYCIGLIMPQKNNGRVCIGREDDAA